MSETAVLSRFPPFLHRLTFVDVALWSLRLLVLVVVIGGTVGTLVRSRYGSAQWVDFILFGITIGSIYAQIALGYTMVYGVLRLINFARGDIMMTGAFAGYFVADSFDRSGFLARQSAIAILVTMTIAVVVSTGSALIVEPKSGSWVIAAVGRIGGICGHGNARTGHHHSPGG